MAGARACAGAAAASAETAAELLGSARRPASRRHSAGAAADVRRAGAGPGAASAGRRLAGGDPGLAGRLVAVGPGNREIPAGLFICVKAVSVRLPGIAGKLSVAGRGEAAAAACSPA